MTNQGLNAYQYPQYVQYAQYPQAYSVPADPSRSAVNVVINAGQPGAYPYYYPYYYPYAQPQSAPPQQPAACPATSLAASAPKPTPVPEPAPEPVPAPAPQQPAKPAEPQKTITPLTAELLAKLKSELTQGDKETRGHAIAKVINLIKEDSSRGGDSRIIGLVNTALHPTQPRAVKAAAIAAIESIKGDNTTRQLLTNIVNAKDTFGDDEAASAALGSMSIPGQRLNVVSK